MLDSGAQMAIAFEGRELRDLKIAAPTGGSGGVDIIDHLLDLCPRTTSITGVTDNGGHSELLRSILGGLPPGDATHQIAVHIKDKDVRQLFTHRWKTQVDSSIHGNRPSNELLAAAEHITGSHSAGIKLLEKAYMAWYVGRVMPISDDNVNLRVHFADERAADSEKYIDLMRAIDAPIVDISFIPQSPRPNPEAIEHIANADLIVIPPGTLWGTLLPILKTPGVSDAFQASRAPIYWFCNAVTTPETHGYTSARYAEKLVEVLGREIDFGFINIPNHNMPPSYAQEESFPVENDLKPSNDFVRNVLLGPLTKLEFIEGKLVIRHNGKVTTSEMVKTLGSQRG